jgi:hypothetical protein
MCAHKIENYEAMKQDIAAVAAIVGSYAEGKDLRVRFGSYVEVKRESNLEILREKGYHLELHGQYVRCFLPLALHGGDGVNMPHFSDRRAGFIIHASAKRVQVQRAKACLLNEEDLINSKPQQCRQQYDIQPDPEGYIQEYSLRKNGYWVAKGEDAEKGKRLHLGALEFQDYNF